MITRGRAQAGGDVELGYLRAGSGPAVVLIHGALSRAEEMASALLPTLASHFDVVAFDRPSHGASRGDGRSGTSWAQAALIHQACRALRLEAPVLVGHSFGGAVAIAYGLQFPEDTAGLVAISPLVAPEARLEHALFGPRAAPVVGDLLNLAAAASDTVLLPLLWRAMFLPQAPPSDYLASFPFVAAGRREALKAGGEDAALLNLGLARSLEALPALKVPLRVLAGDADLVVNNRLHGQLAALLAPDGAFRLLPGLGHMLHHFAQDQVLAAVRSLHHGPELRRAS